MPTRSREEEEGESLALLLQERALAASPWSLAVQAGAGLALNAASLWWHPDAWPVPVLTGVALAAHAAWAFALRRELAPRTIDDADVAADDADDAEPDDAPPATWVRRVSATVGLVALFGLFAVLGVGLLGRLQS
ncbi:MAG TPA: hypothetical protein PKE51_04375 [Gemmatimonadaceae bacterium]|nr:hypothetical protein [Gemmatimonadaceae bacterium]